MLKKSFIWLYSAATYLLWAVVIAGSLGMLVLRYFVLPELHTRKDVIATYASEAIGLRVSIGDIRANWNGLHPHVDLIDVNIFDAENRPALTLGHIEAEPSWLSLAMGELRLASLVVHEPALTVRREQDGAVYVAGISMRGPSRPEFPNWLLRQSQVDIVGASVLWRDEMRGAPPLALENLSLRLSSAIWESMLDRHHFGLRATPSAGLSKPIDIRGDLTGSDVSHPEQWSGIIYGELQGANFEAWRQWVDYPFRLRHGTGATRFWLEFTHGKADRITADVVLNNVIANMTQEAPDLVLNDLSGRLAWQQMPDGYAIQINRIKLSSASGLRLNDFSYSARRRQVGGKEVMEASSKLADIDLGQLVTFSTYLPLDQPMRDKIAGISPKGRVRNFHINWTSKEAELGQYGIGGQFSNLSIKPYQGLPGFSGLTGTLDADQDGGTLTLDSKGAQIDMSNRLRRAIPADRLSGRMTWTQRQGKLDAKIANLAISGPYIVGAVSGDYQHNADGNSAIDLAGKLKLLGADGFDIRDGAVRVNLRPVGDKTASDGDIRLDDIRLEQVAAFAATLPLEQELLDKLREIVPRGQMRELHATWAADASGLRRYSLSSNFSELGMRPYLGIPGFAGLAGSLEASQDGGTLRLDTPRALLDLPDVLRWPIPENKLDGEIRWTRKNGNLALKINELSISNPHLAGSFNGSYLYAGKGAGSIDLNGKITRADGKYALYYYPKILSQDTLHWLDTSVLAGRSDNTTVVVRGNLDEFPWADNKHGLFQIKGLVTQGLLDYADNWPRIEDMQVNLLFQGSRMELNSSQGHLFGNQITRARAVIPDLDAQHPVLKLTGELQSPVEDAIKYINKSPLLEATDRFTEHMQASGNGRLLLDLEIPLDTEGIGSKVKGSYQVSNGRLAASDDMPGLENINGRFDFTESSLRAQNVGAQIYGGPAQFSLENGKDGQLRITAQARLGDAAIRQASGLVLADKLHGTADWNAEINLFRGRADLLVKSSLSGLSSSLPEPFNKAAGTTLPLVLEKKTQDVRQDTISVRLDNILSAKILRKAQGGVMRAERGEIVFGGGNAELPAKAGIALKGNIARVDIDQWQTLSSGPAETKSDFPISSANLAIGALDVFGRRINALRINAVNSANGWQAGVQSEEINGDVQLLQSAGGDKVVARLKSLSVPSLAPAKLSEPTTEPRKETEYPALDIVAEEFNLPGKKLGKLEVLAKPQGNDWNIDKLLVSNPDSTLTMDGKLQNWKRNPTTSFNLNWDISDIGKTMERYGRPDIIKGGKGSINGQLRWRGSIHDYDPAILDGNLSLAAEKGQVLKIKSGVGRLFSILSLQNLPRRLTFDFRDVFSDGFAFDKIDSNLRAAQGVVHIDKFRMEGPAAKVDIKGVTDLVKETQNLHVKVTPAISGSVALAACVGGPVVCAAVWAAQKVFRDPADKLAAYEFDVIGTWSDPQEVSSKKTPIEPTPELSPMGN